MPSTVFIVVVLKLPKREFHASKLYFNLIFNIFLKSCRRKEVCIFFLILVSHKNFGLPSNNLLKTTK